MTSIECEMASPEREITSPKREMTSRKRETTSWKHEMTSRKCEMTSRKREMVSLKFAIKLPASFSAFAPRRESKPIPDETERLAHRTFYVPTPLSFLLRQQQ